MSPILNDLALFITARMISHLLLSCEETHPERISFQRQVLIDILNGDRIIIGLEANAPSRMHQHFRYWPDIRRMRWQGSQLAALQFQTGENRLSAPCHDPLLI